MALKKMEDLIASSLGVSQKSFHQFGEASLAAAKDLAMIGGAATAIGGALFAAAEHAAHFAEEIGHVAEKSGATAEQVSTLNFAANRFGVSTDAVSTGLRFLARDLGDIAEGGGKKAATAFHDLGINVHDAHGKVRAVSDVLPELIERLGGMEAGGRRTADAIAIFGRGGAALIPMLGEFRGGFKAIEDQARSMGLVVGHDDVIAGEKFLVTQRQMTAEVNALTIRLGKEFMPVIVELLMQLEHYPIVLKEIGLSALNLVSYLAGPVGMLTRWLYISPKLREEQQKMIDLTNAEVIAIDKEVKAALASGISHEGADAATKTHTKAIHEYTDLLAGQLLTTEEKLTELRSRELPARQRIELEIQKQIDAATREIDKDRELFAQKKIGLMELENGEREYTQLVAYLAEERSARLHQEMDKELDDAVKHLGAMKFAMPLIPASFFTPLTDGVKQLTAAEVAALPTQRELATIHRELVTLFPQLTKEQIDAKTAELARNSGLIHLVIQQGEMTKGTKLYRQETQTLIQTIRELSGVEDPRLAKAREMRVTQEQMRQEMLQTTAATLGAGIAAAIYGENIGKAMEQAAKAALASFAGEAGINSLKAALYGAYYLAKYIGSWGTDAAALAASEAFFINAAEWGAITGGAGAAAAAMPSGAARGAGAGAGRGSGPGPAEGYGGGAGGPNTGTYGMAPGAAPPGGPPSGQLTVMVVGDAVAGQWLADTLNRSTQRGAQLNATSVQKSPYAAG